MNCYDRDGKPITWEEYSKLYQETYSRIALTQFDDGSTVSTVWLGIDHSFGGNSAPIIFETMIFSAAPDADELCWRYSTEEEALEGHERAVLDWMKDIETSRVDL